MREAVHEGWKALDRLDDAVPFRKGARLLCAPVGQSAHLGQRPQPAPDTGGRAPFEKHRAAMCDDQHRDGTLGQRSAYAPARKFGDPAFEVRHARVDEGTHGAVRARRPA